MWLSNLEFSKIIMYYIINMNVNNGTNNRIPFDPNPRLFRKGPRNGIIKKSSSNELRLDIVYFGEIRFDEKKYYKYACYNHNGKIQYLELIRSANGTRQGINKTNHLHQLWERGGPPHLPQLTFSSTKQVHLPQNIRRVPQNFENRGPRLVVRKINQKKINNNTDLSEILGDFSFIEDPNGIDLSELEKKDNDFPFKIIRKSSLFPVKVGEPIILFGEITINREKYYQYCCYKSRGIGSKDGVSFRKLSNNPDDLKKFRNKTLYNRNASVFLPINQNSTPMKERTYLYFIGINDVETELLKKLFLFIEHKRSSKGNQLLFRTIFDQLSQVVGNNSKKMFELQQMNQRNTAFNGNPKKFFLKKNQTEI